MEKLTPKTCEYENNTICNGEFILTGSHDIITKETQKERCVVDCEQRHVCKAVLDLLANGKLDVALEIMQSHKNDLLENLK